MTTNKTLFANDLDTTKENAKFAKKNVNLSLR